MVEGSQLRDNENCRENKLVIAVSNTDGQSISHREDETMHVRLSRTEWNTRQNLHKTTSFHTDGWVEATWVDGWMDERA